MSEKSLMVERTYDESDIKHYEGLDQVRNKPTIYIGTLGPNGAFHLFKEGIVNVLDEFLAGRCTLAHVKINPIINEIVIEDDGPGIPIGKARIIFNEMFTSGKYDKSANGAYLYSTGTNGVGTTILNALSEYLFVDIYRDGKHAHGEFEKGVEKEWFIEDYDENTHGTILKYRPDVTVLQDITMDINKYKDTCEMLTYINPGFKCVFECVDASNKWNTQTFLNVDGMFGYMDKRIVKNKKIKLVHQKPIQFKNSTEIVEDITLNGVNGKINQGIKHVGMEYDIVVSWGENSPRGGYVESFVNGVRTVNNGTHVTGAKMAITRSIKEFIDKEGLIPKSSKIVIQGDDVHDCILLVVSAKHSDPIYTTQIKDALDNSDIQSFINTSLYAALSTYLKSNVQIAKEICKLIIRSAKARIAAKEARANVIKSGKITVAQIDLEKYTGCKSNNPCEKELFIVEGDSAGGSAKKARDSNSQAVFRIRGKLKNMIQSNTLSDEVRAILEVVGCGIGEKCDIRKCNFHTIVIATDADSDGYHISTLIQGMFYALAPAVIQAGYLYEARPPLYQLTFGRGNNERSVFIPDQHYFNKSIYLIATKSFKLVSRSGVVLPKEMMEIYIKKLFGFKSFIERYAVQTVLSPELLECIIYNYIKIRKNDFSGLEAMGYEITVEDKKNGRASLLSIDKEYDHFCVSIDEDFEEFIYKPVSKRMEEIYLFDVHFEGRTGTKYGGTMYRNSLFLENLLLGKDIQVRRIKGLGESNAEELRHYMFNRTTRNIYKITMKDAEETGKMFDILLGKNIEGKKELLRTHL